MDRQPHLVGERVRLRPLAPTDWDALYAVARDPKIWEQHPKRDRWKEAVFRDYFADAIASGGALAVVDVQDDAVIGCSQYRPTPFDQEAIEIGWTFLARSAWRTGINREMKRLMLEHAMASVRRVLFRVGEENRRSREAVEGLGARLTTLREELDYKGRAERNVVYEMTRELLASGPLGAKL